MNINFEHNGDLLNSVIKEQYHRTVDTVFDTVYRGTGAGNGFLGWVGLPSSVSDGLIADIEETANRLRSKSSVFVVIGIGGSYLGARAVIEALTDPFAAIKEDHPVVVYAGHNMSEDYLSDLLTVLDKKDYSLVVISKSGTTTEPAIAFRLLKQHLNQKYGKEEASTRIIAITDKAKGALRQLANREGYKTYVVPDDIGGRFSVLTPVGLLPIAVAGIDIRKLVEGARDVEQFCKQHPQLEGNPVAEYALMRHLLYQGGKTTEVLVNYEPSLCYFSEWWKQLFGESHGKNLRGIFPASVTYSTDLHSMGQYMQEGLRTLFETVISVENPRHELHIPSDADDLDQLNYLAGKRLNEVNHKAELGTILAHEDGGVPNLRLTIPEISEQTIGELIYFFEMACALGGYLLEVNPFDQPGVEAYKKNMFALLGKKGYEKEAEGLNRRLNQQKLG